MRNRRQEAVAVARMKIVVTAEQEGVSAAARRWECARSTVQRLVRRFQQGGVEALCNQPRGPRGAISEQVRDLIVELKLGLPVRSCEKIRRLLEELEHSVSRQTIWRVLSEKGLARVQEREPLRRFVHSQPNDLWQLDVMEEEPVRFGKVHLVAALDDHSRFCVGAQFVHRKGEADILGALAGFLRRWGLPKALLTDRAVIFWGRAGDLAAGMTTYQMALGSLAVRAAFAAPYKPRTKGKVERFFSFVQRDFLAEHRGGVRDLDHLNRELAEWLEFYNHRRPHASLREGTPGQHYRGSQRAAPPELESLLAVETSRRVNRASAISFRGQQLQVPSEYLGQRVWLQLLGDQLTIRAQNNRTIATYSVANL